MKAWYHLLKLTALDSLPRHWNPKWNLMTLFVRRGSRATGKDAGRLQAGLSALLPSMLPALLPVWLLMLLATSGCTVQRRQRIPDAIQAPALQQATLEELIEKIQIQQDTIRTLQATVELAPSVTSPDKGEIVQYRDVRAFILIRKPAFLRMIGQYPVVRSTAFDMASDGETFRLYIPSKNRFIIGKSREGRRSKSALENLRPQHILDALLVRGPEPGHEQAVLEVASEGRNSFYIVHILRAEAAGKLALARKIWFERQGLALVRLQIYDESAEVVNDVRYSNHAEFSGISYPRQITLDRPKDLYGLNLSISKLEFNQPLGEEKFSMEQPPGTELINLEQQSLPEGEIDVG
ncbi:MAG: hypothetical protein V3T65_04300 [Acidobacteriota bacterium]